MNISKNMKVTLVKAAQSSAGTAINSDSVDMSGFEGVMFVGTIATVDADNFANAAQSSDDSSFADLEGTKDSPVADGNSFAIDIYRPTKRYVRVEIDRGGANTATGDIYAIQYGARKAAVSHGSTIDAETHISPDEGTA
jgi:hypothetical protein